MSIDFNDESNINPAGGYFRSSPNKATIDPPNLNPELIQRYRISPALAAKIETIARGRTTISKIISEDAKARWASEEYQTALALSVNASSQIEGEEVHADMVPLIFDDLTEVEEGAPISHELSHRLGVARGIYKAYLWALTEDRKDAVTVSFLKELHSRMFEKSSHYGEIAGKIKSQEIVISGSRYHVTTLTHTKAEKALEKLCDRVNADFSRNSRDRHKPLLLIIAEFVIDFLAIHPFRDGNGRTARLLSTYLLERIGYHFAPIYPIDSIINENRKAYFEALFNGQKNWYLSTEDLTEWVEFYVDCVLEQWERAYRKIKRSPRDSVSLLFP